MSEDLISREKAYEVLSEYYHHKTELQHKALREALDRVPPVELQPTCNPDKISQFIDGIEEMFANIRERFIHDSVCGLCEYDGAYVGESGDWYNECPGFEKDDCFKLSDKTRKEWTEEIIKALPSAEPKRKTGKWLLVEYPDGYYHVECSECGEEFAEDLYWREKVRFCPCCGAELRGSENE